MAENNFDEQRKISGRDRRQHPYDRCSYERRRCSGHERGDPCRCAEERFQED